MSLQTATMLTLSYPVLRGGRQDVVCDLGCSNVWARPTFAERTTAGFCCQGKFPVRVARTVAVLPFYLPPGFRKVISRPLPYGKAVEQLVFVTWWASFSVRSVLSCLHEFICSPDGQSRLLSVSSRTEVKCRKFF